MNNSINYLKALLDENAKILEINCTLLDSKVDSSKYIGKNWFDTFIEETDKEKVMKTFKELLLYKKNWKTWSNDIKIHKEHRLIDFYSEVIVKDKKKFIKFHGIEHFHNC